MTQPSRVLGYALYFIALVAAANALFFGYYGAKLVYLAAIFGGDDSLGRGMSIVFGLFSYLTVVTAAVFFPLIAVVAAAIALFCWKAGKRSLNISG